MMLVLTVPRLRMDAVCHDNRLGREPLALFDRPLQKCIDLGDVTSGHDADIQVLVE